MKLLLTEYGVWDDDEETLVMRDKGVLSTSSKKFKLSSLQSSFSDVRILFGAFLIIVLNQMDEKEVHQTWEW